MTKNGFSITRLVICTLILITASGCYGQIAQRVQGAEQYANEAVDSEKGQVVSKVVNGIVDTAKSALPIPIPTPKTPDKDGDGGWTWIGAFVMALVMGKEPDAVDVVTDKPKTEPVGV